MNELDIVIAKKDLSKQVLSGCIGTIVMVLTTPSLAYLIEFFDENKNTIDIIPVSPEDIEPIYY